MANYLVGLDDATFFRRCTTWDFLPALDAAQDGDIIELQSNIFIEFEERISITKNITIKGQVEKNEQGQTILPTINGRMAIWKGAQVNLENIYIQNEKSKTNTLNVSGKSTITATNILIENTAQEGENYPIIYIAGDSIVDLNDILIKESKIHDGNHCVYIENSNLKCINSNISASLHIINSSVTCENMDVSYSESNAISIKNKANVILKNCSINGGVIEKKFPCLICRDSYLDLSDSNVFQKKYTSACYGVNSNIILANNRIDSAQFLKSEIRVNKTTFVESIFLQDKTEFSGDRVSILGRKNGKVNLFADSKSKIKVDEFWFGKITYPNIKLNRNVDFDVKKIYVLEYDPEKEAFIADSNNKINIVKTNMKTEYFGEKNAYEQLNDMIGLKQVKSEVTEFVTMAQMNKSRKNKGLRTSKTTLHSLFLGNPGTGKTTVARIVGRLLYEKGIISSEKFVESSRSDLVGQYVGETAQKTKKILESALGGVLFIDEAYSLATDSKNDYGAEAVNEILKFMEDHREDIVIIFAGYTDSMKKFLDMNEGLKSRIPNVFHFEDYSVEELTVIGLESLKSEGYKVDKEAYIKLIKHNFKLSDDRSNGRWIRNINEKLIKRLAVRLLKDSKTDLSLISIEDINATKM
ncbi:AAA family ATPase [Pediococcus pentosaceus]|uniref:AAA family ATPase n=1 Tax=Pediococcus pentosaceus TaxID=1255 RepID=UPI00190AC754|nr:AAA family ATPase [Pediococcus pentosaceus]MBF7125044.1 AAA family ATPase [Pediococcus pentosaceus]WPK17004.1 AAA family ATPase [Pediococcus pentosaceus]